jgi:hypothetical protein
MAGWRVYVGFLDLRKGVQPESEETMKTRQKCAQQNVYMLCDLLMFCPAIRLALSHTHAHHAWVSQHFRELPR